MGIQIREATSEEMKKNIRTVKKMTKGMGFDENMGKVNWKFVRAISNFGYQFMPRKKEVKFSNVMFGNVKTLLAEYGKEDNSHIIIYIHGGGFVSGSAKSSKGYSSMLARYSGYKVYSINYRLAPENPFPDGFNDCYYVLCEVCKLYPQAKITLIGESAGANLCVALALKDRTKVSSVIVHSPFMDFTGSINREEHQIDDFTVKAGCLKALNDIYVKKEDNKNPYISPVFGDYKGFPATFITCDYNETLYADAKILYNKCFEENVDVTMIEMKNSFHAFATIGTGTPETRKILEENIDFIKNKG